MPALGPVLASSQLTGQQRQDKEAGKGCFHDAKYIQPKDNLWQPTFLVLKYFFSHEMMLVDGTYFLK